MIKPRLRLYVCASAVAVTLGGSVLTQAAGPREFISKLWNREPTPKKEVASGFSPFNWLRREETNASADRIRISDHGRRVVSERPSLVIDPFLNEQRPDTTPRTTTAGPPTPGSKGVIVRPQTRRQPVATLDLDPPATRQTLSQPSNATGRTQMAASAPGSSTNRTATAAQQSLPEVSSAPAPAAGNGNFVDGFDRKFQKLFEEVIEESRQNKANTTTPRLPDRAVVDFEQSGAEALPEASTSTQDRSKKDLADFAQERSQPGLTDLIEDSRSQMESSLLARRAANHRGPQHSSAGLSFPQQSDQEQAGVAAVSHSDSRHAQSVRPANSDSGFMPQMLPDRVPQTVNPLIVPSSIVPERRMFTTSDGWMNRGELERQHAADSGSPPDLQPVVRVVPGRRGAGVKLETGQRSPIQPRVSSNVAPARSVPDTSRFRRLSFEGSAAYEQSGSAVQTIGDGSSNQSSNNRNSEVSDQSPLMIPSASSSGSFVPSDSGSNAASDDMAMMIIPDSRTGQSLDAAELGAALAVVPAPPESDQPVFEWPDEAEIAAETSHEGFSWRATLLFLAMAGGAIGLFFRRKAQGGALVITTTGSEPEIF